MLGNYESDVVGTRSQLKSQGVGAKSATTAHVAIQVPRPALHAMMAGGTPTMVTPKVKPAPA